jgi:PAS domain S-box-containing protein
LQAINLTLYVAFLAILILQIIVYRIVQLGVIKPILASIKSADALGAGNLDTTISTPSGQSEISLLLGALIQLQNNLIDQKAKKEELTSSLERKVLARTEELSSALQALESAQKTTIAVIDSSFDAIALLDNEGRIQEWNLRASKMFGLSHEEAMNEPMPRFLLNEQHAERFYAEGVFDPAPLSDELIELTGHSKAKDRIDLEGFITALKIDQIEQWVVFLRDVTLSKSIADAIDNQRIVGSSVLDGLPISVSLESRIQDYVLQNEAYRTLEDQGFTELGSGTETERRESTWEEGASGPWDLVLSNEEETRTFIGAMRIIEPDIPDQERYLLRYLVDVTELKAQEKQLREALASKDAFVSAITHELRTPLHSIVACLDLINTTQRPDDIDARQYVSVAKSSSETLLSLINELLDFQKTVDRDLQLVNDPFQFFAIFQQSSDMCHILFEGTAINFKSAFKGDEQLRLVGDARRITQLITNIVGNARKFTKQGEVSMTVDCQPHSSGGFVLRFKITDSGIGMDQKTLAHLGESFFQGTTGVSREFGGTGLGLSIVKQILSAMNSELMVESTLGVGSSVSFELRLPEANSAEIEEMEAIEPGTLPLPSIPDPELDYRRSGSLKVLYVEDTDMNRLVMKAMMNKFAVELTMAESAVKGLKLARENRFDLIITDIQMPFHTGIELRQWLAGDDEIHAPNIIAFTANAETAKLKEYSDIGFNDVLTKPLTLAKLGSFLRPYLDAL